MTTESELIQSILLDVDAKKDALMDDVDAYVAHVFEGHDPAKLPNGKSLYWYCDTALKGYAQRIVNAYRETRGLPPNPFSPVVPAYRLFDFLCTTEWKSAKSASSIIGGQRIETYIKDYSIRDEGWMLEKTKIKGAVHYRIVKRAEVLV